MSGLLLVLLLAASTPSDPVAPLLEAARADEARGDDLAAAADLWRAADTADHVTREYARAISLYGELVTRYPSARLARGAVLRRDYLQRGTSTGEDPFRRLEVVRAEYAHLDRSAAKAEVRAILRDHPDFPLGDECVLWLGDRALEDGEPGAARSLFQELLARWPQSPQKGYALAGVANADFALKDYQGAKEAFADMAHTDSVAAQFVSAREVELVERHVARERRERWVEVGLTLLGLGALASLDWRRLSGAVRRSISRELLYAGPIFLALALLAPAEGRMAIAALSAAAVAYLWLALVWAEAARPALLARLPARAGALLLALAGGAGVIYSLLYAMDLLVAVERI